MVFGVWFQFADVNAILSCGPSIFQSANVPLLALGMRNCHESVYLGRHCLCDAGHGQVGEKNAVAHRCPLHGGVLGSDGGRRPLGSCFSQSSSPLARADARVPLHVCVCDFLGRGAVGLPQRNLSHEREGESDVHGSLLPMGRQFPQQVHLTSVLGTFAFYAVYCAGAFALVCAFVSVTKGLLLEEMGRLFGEPLEVPEGCVPQTCWVSLSVCGWVSRVHRDMSWCHCLCVCVCPCLYVW